MNAFRFAVLFFGFTLAPCFAEDAAPLPAIVTVGAVTYSNVTWGSVSPVTVTIFHQTGIATLSLASLSPEVRHQLGYDPQKAAEYLSGLQRMEADRQEAIRKAQAEADASRSSQRKEVQETSATVSAQKHTQDQLLILARTEGARSKDMKKKVEDGARSLGLPPSSTDIATFTGGDTVISFSATTTEGNRIRFPEDYKGKVVLLDFWATWCAPCRVEVPHIVAAYQQYHSKGFDILGISLDEPQTGSRLAQFTRDNHMPWPEVFGGKSLSPSLALLFNIHYIPHPILVDGDSRLILADGSIGPLDDLVSVIQKALAIKTAPTPASTTNTGLIR